MLSLESCCYGLHLEWDSWFPRHTSICKYYGVFTNGIFQAWLHIHLFQETQRINTSYLRSIAKQLNLEVKFPKNSLVQWKSAKKLSVSKLSHFGAFFCIYTTEFKEKCCGLYQEDVFIHRDIYLLERWKQKLWIVLSNQPPAMNIFWVLFGLWWGFFVYFEVFLFLTKYEWETYISNYLFSAFTCVWAYLLKPRLYVPTFLIRQKPLLRESSLESAL